MGTFESSVNSYGRKTIFSGRKVVAAFESSVNSYGRKTCSDILLNRIRV